MSQKIINGFTGVIAPPNLATNGAFKINQRGGNVNSTYTPATGGTYVADSWYINGASTSIEFVETSWHSNGWIRFRGNGKKNQLLFLNNRDNSGFGHDKNISNNWNQLPLTATVVVENKSNINLKARAIPRWGVQHTVMYEKDTLIPKDSIKQTDTCMFLGDAQPNYTNGGQIIITLEEDGEYDFILHSYQEVRGLFKKLPWTSPVPYADDLVRCQRYYQTGQSNTIVQWVKKNTNVAEYRVNVDLATTMASSPSVVSELHRSVYVRNGVGGNSADQSSLVSVTPIDLSDHSIRFDCLLTDATYAPQAYNNGSQIIIHWYAEVV